jgi:hypothetical protein
MRRRRGLAFLCCAVDDAKVDRLRRSVDALERPDGFDVDLFVEREATGLSAGYNRLLARAAGWRYKAYVHEDVVILNRSLVPDLLRIFRRRSIALVGAAGCRYLPESCVWWDGSGVFGHVVEYVDGVERVLELEQPAGEYELVEAVDGLCMITQHDLPWDESIGGFHFYDVAQSTRYVLAGYDVAVPRQVEPWFGHDATTWDERRKAEFDAAREAFRARYDASRRRFARSRLRRRSFQARRRLLGRR